VHLPPGRSSSGCVVELAHKSRCSAIVHYLGHLAESTFSF
jgi:hypothetical protein